MVELRPVLESDLDETYVSWMNDPEVVRYLEVWYPQTLQTITDYWLRHRDKADEPWFAIVVEGVHIGNIKLGPINWIHRHADLSLFIGEKDYWGNGYGTEAINLMVNFAFNKLNLHKVKAGVYAQNIGSLAAFRKAGFVEAGRLAEDRWLNGSWAALILMEKLRA